MSRLICLSLSDKAFDTLKLIPWGQKSKIISEYIESLDSGQETMKNPQLPNPEPFKPVVEEEKKHDANDGANVKTASSRGSETSERTSETKKHNVNSWGILSKQFRSTTS